jgi:transcriptional regulator EpsA
MYRLNNFFNRVDCSALVTVLESLERVLTTGDLIKWTQADLQAVFPHGAFVACVGKVLNFGIQPHEVISVNIPEKSMDEAHYAKDCFHTFLMQHWLKNGEPQLFDMSMDASGLNLGCLKAFRASELQNIAAHGVFEMNRAHMSFFSFHQLPFPPGDEQKRILKLIVPAMHAAFLRCVHVEVKPVPDASTQRRTLTPREKEVLGWICQGKTNSEIGSILEISPHTVKNQTQTILVKMKVNTRAQAASEAMRLRLVSYS